MDLETFLRHFHPSNHALVMQLMHALSSMPADATHVREQSPRATMAAMQRAYSSDSAYAHESDNPRVVSNFVPTGKGGGIATSYTIPADSGPGLLFDRTAPRPRMPAPVMMPQGLLNLTPNR